MAAIALLLPSASTSVAATASEESGPQGQWTSTDPFSRVGFDAGQGEKSSKTSSAKANGKAAVSTAETENPAPEGESTSAQEDEDEDAQKAKEAQEAAPAEREHAEDGKAADGAKKSQKGLERATAADAGKLSARAGRYAVEVSFGADAEVPDGAKLEVAEVASSKQEGYADKARRALGRHDGDDSPIHLLDIKIVNRSGEKVEIAAPVAVSVSLAGDDAAKGTEVVHFAEAGAAQVVDGVKCDDDKGIVSFSADGFSVYAIVEPETSTDRVSTLEELAANADKAVFLSVTRGSSNKTYYFKNTLNGNSCFELAQNNISAASAWFFEASDGGGYKIYTYVAGVKKYMHNKSGNLMELSSTATVFDMEQGDGDAFYLKVKDASKWLQYSNGGSGMRLWTDKNNAGNSLVTITLDMTDDPYGLDGAEYGIAFSNGVANARAMNAEEGSGGTLTEQKVTIQPDVRDNDGLLLVAQGTDVDMWHFTCESKNTYSIWANTPSGVRYLSLDGNALSLSATKGENEVFEVTLGAGSNSGKLQLTCGTSKVAATNGGFKGAASGNVWLNLLTETDVDDDVFTTYTARKVSVSDTVSVSDGEQLVVYTRVWDASAGRYVTYVVDHDGSLIKCTDNGETIEWIGTNSNTALWEFTEYTDASGNPNNYYELENVQYGNYIAPCLSAGQTMSDSTIGLNLEGRRMSRIYSSIAAWDENGYSYSALGVSGNHVDVCPLSEGADFYFAVMTVAEQGEDGKLDTVETVKNSDYGITMKMFDFNGQLVGDREPHQQNFLGSQGGKGLLSTNVGADGYPTATAKAGTASAGHSFAELIAGSDGAVDADRLFLKSVLDESGYFEYDSTQNFAHFNDDGTFTVYRQIGAITGNSERKNTRTHGQFMPYDDIYDDELAYGTDGKPITNLTDVYGNELADTDTRKGEQLYRIGGSGGGTTTVDYFFGMEMEAGFTQTADGLDAWDHDIVFEFSGDDDFWLYVDGELVLDLGGVHSAQVGTVNFRTGAIKSSTGNSTLYDTFKANFEARGMSSAEVAAKLAEIFEEKTVDGKTVRVFKDYSNHTMKMLYMERGAGASNLHMRFNLASVKPGTFILSKQLSGTDSPKNDCVEAAYQIYYTDEYGVERLLGDGVGETSLVKYQNSTANVRHKASWTPSGGTDAYRHVYFLNPGQSAEVQLPAGAVSYRVVECGVNPDIYDAVTINGDDVDTCLDGDGEGTGWSTTANMAGNTARRDYLTDDATTDERATVVYDNHVSELAVRSVTITKKLYDVDGTTLLHYPVNSTLFDFRLMLGDEDEDLNDLPAASMYPYYVKDPSGNYCRWDIASGRFVSLGITTYDALAAYLATCTAQQYDAVVFITSMHGAISKVPADYTIEVRDLIAGTKFSVEERDNDVPRGYTRREGDGYVRCDTAEPCIYTTESGQTVQVPLSQKLPTQIAEPISDTVEFGESPAIEVRNQKGWGLTARKVWTDADFMSSHDTVYLAIYVDAGNGEELYPQSVRAITSSDTEAYWFFDDLSFGNTTVAFSSFTVREVELGGAPVVGADGVVSGYTTIDKLDDGGTTTVSGTPVGSSTAESNVYTVGYEVGQPTGHNENIRTDTVENSRPGIEIVKVEPDDATPLAGATFTICDGDGSPLNGIGYTSDSGGLVTCAYLTAGTYSINETAAPAGYVGLSSPVTFEVLADGHVANLSGDAASLVSVENHTGASRRMNATLTVRNNLTSFVVKKVSAEDGEGLSGAVFNLYRQVKDASGAGIPEIEPMMRGIESGESGVIAALSGGTLAPGTYYLRETAAPDGYGKLARDLCFTLATDGTVRVETPEYAGWLTLVDDGAGMLSYVLSIEDVGFVEIEMPMAGGVGAGALVALAALGGGLAAWSLMEKVRRRREE